MSTHLHINRVLLFKMIFTCVKKFANLQFWLFGNIHELPLSVLRLNSVLPDMKNTLREIFANFLDLQNSQIFPHRKLFHLY